MTRIVRRRFRFFGSSEEEAWLNDMASRGFVLTSKKWNRFEFEECRPNEYVILQYFPKADEDKGKMLKNEEFTRQTGLECVCIWGGVAYFRKKKGNPFEFDPRNRIKHYKKMTDKAVLWMIASVIWCLNAVIDYFSLSDWWPDQWFLPVFNLAIFVCWIALGIVWIVTLVRIKKEKKEFLNKLKARHQKA